MSNAKGRFGIHGGQNIPETLMTAEIAIGRKTGLSAIGAFTTLDKRFKFLGILASAVPIINFPYYSLIGG